MSGCKGKEWHTASGAVWGTTYNITYLGDVDLSDSIVAVMARVESSLSPFSPASTISRINRSEADRLDSLCGVVFAASREVWQASGGAFDPTVAPAVNLWGFGYRNSGADPSAADIDSVKALVDFSATLVKGDSIIRPRGTEYDFSAITKGFGCDMVAAMLSRNGCSDYMVEIGGEIAAGGRNKRHDRWHIMIDRPIESDTAVVHRRLAVIAVSDCGIATSGNYRNFRRTAEGKVWHTIDPRTCRPAEPRLLSATVIAPTAMVADALATACMVLGPDSAAGMIESWPCAEALFVVASPGSGDSILTTRGFPL